MQDRDEIRSIRADLSELAGQVHELVPMVSQTVQAVNHLSREVSEVNKLVASTTNRGLPAAVVLSVLIGALTLLGGWSSIAGGLVYMHVRGETRPIETRLSQMASEIEQVQNQQMADHDRLADLRVEFAQERNP